MEEARHDPAVEDVMAEDRPKLPVNIDVSVGARAELKGEIPQSSMGRLVDSLTDAIRPFTEARGLRADQIRLQREDVMIAIALKAQRRLAIENQSPGAIPPRILVPLLEKASLADPNDDVLIDAWANLLASASRGVRANHGIYVDILSKLDSQHLRFLDFLAQPENLTAPPDEFLRFATDSLRNEIEPIVNPYLEPITKNGMLEEYAADISNKASKLFRKRGSCLISGWYEQDFKDTIFECEILSQRNFVEFPESISGALESLNIIKREEHLGGPGFAWRLWANYHVLTVFGMEFFYTGRTGKNIVDSEIERPQ